MLPSMPKTAPPDAHASDYNHVVKGARGLAREKLRAAIVAESNAVAAKEPEKEPLAVAHCSCGWTKSGARSLVVAAAGVHASGHSAKGTPAVVSSDFEPARPIRATMQEGGRGRPSTLAPIRPPVSGIRS